MNIKPKTGRRVYAKGGTVDDSIMDPASVGPPVMDPASRGPPVIDPASEGPPVMNPGTTRRIMRGEPLPESEGEGHLPRSGKGKASRARRTGVEHVL
jgi:hypothetical protein